METLIVICLLTVIALLLHDKSVIKKAVKKEENTVKSQIRFPDIMGLPKPFKRLSVPNTSFESQNKKQIDAAYNFAHETENKDLNKQIPQEELDEVFGEVPDLREEEEEWNRYGAADDDYGFAEGVTFEELGAAVMVLREERPELSLQKKAAATVQKIQGTDLFSLLENSMEGASRKIAELLNKSLSTETESGSSILRNNNLDDFDIEEFL